MATAKKVAVKKTATKKTATKKAEAPKKTAAKKSTKKKTASVDAEKKLSETEVVIVLDRSGSMCSIQDATVKGFNEFINEQKNAEGDAFVTLVQFDDRYELNYKSKPVNEVTKLVVGETFIPRGMTALHDAIGKTISELETDRDVTFVIITDGDENSSREYTGAAIKKMIKDSEKDKQWKFVYLGANQDAVIVAKNYGISGANALTYTADANHTTMAFANVSTNVSSLRSSKMHFLNKMKIDSTVTYSTATMDMMAKDLEFSDEQRSKSLDNGKH
jgi:hypothetical protein